MVETGALVFGCITPHPPVLVPEVGGARAAEVQATARAMEELGRRMAGAEPETLLLVSPHGPYHRSAMGILMADSSWGDFASWGVSEISFAYENDLELVQAIRDEADRAGVPLEPTGEDGCELDWGVTVPMYFLGRELPDVRLTPLTYSLLPLSDHLDYGRAIGRAVRRAGRRAAFVASGDLSHRLLPGAPAGFDPVGEVYDRQMADALRDYDVGAIMDLDPEMVARAGECGLRSIIILLGALEGLKVEPEVLSYEGPFGVGYLVASFKVEE